MNFSSPFASPLSIFPDIKSEFSPAVSIEELNSFHSIDRNLYSLLVHKLGKLPPVSLQIMGFWLFLEHEASGLVNTLLHWPLNLINTVFNESLLCLRDMHKGSLSNEKSDDEELIFLSRLLKKSVTRMNFVENRDTILSKVEYEVNHIDKALQDVPSRPEMVSPHFVVPNQNSFTNLGNGTRVHTPTRTSSIGKQNNGTGVYVPIISTGEANSSNVIPFPRQHYHSQQVVGDLRKGDYHTGHFGKSKEKQQEEAMAVDRTIFLKFSKGYPLTESEVRDFFTRRFGDFIESIEMQVVKNGEKPLSAKIVSKSIEMANIVVEGGKANYYINKKHVCARKFILL